MNKVTDVLSFISKHSVKFIKVSVIDILGEKRSVELPISLLPEIRAHHVMCDASSIKGGPITVNSDMAIRIDESSVALQSGGILEIYGSLMEKGANLATDSRFILKKATDVLSKRGYILNVGLEPEFYLLDKLNYEPIDDGDYFTYLYDDVSAKIRRQAVEALMSEGYVIGPFHHEAGPGQCEINFAFADALTLSDRLYRYKEIIKTTADKHNAIATFYPKPFKDLPGSGMHLNCSLASLDGRNVFYSSTEEGKISSLTRQFISGIMYHLPALTALACTIENSYSRMHSGSESPGRIFWSFMDRTAAIRVPLASEEKTRIELRFVDNTANIYLLLAGIIYCGLDGIDHPLRDFDKDKSADMRSELPRCLDEALKDLASDDILNESLGFATIKLFTDYCRKEIKEPPFAHAVKKY